MPNITPMNINKTWVPNQTSSPQPINAKTTIDIEIAVILPTIAIAFAAGLRSSSETEVLSDWSDFKFNFLSGD